jgi:hypothetical protein
VPISLARKGATPGIPFIEPSMDKERVFASNAVPGGHSETPSNGLGFIRSNVPQCSTVLVLQASICDRDR